MSFIVKFYISPNYALILRPYLVCLVERGKNYITSEKVNKREEGNKRHFFTECNIKKRYIVYLWEIILCIYKIPFVYHLGKILKYNFII